MDISTVIGTLIGLGIMYYSMAHESGGNLGLFWNQGAAVLIAGGLISGIFMSFKLNQVLAVINMLKKCFIYPLPAATQEIERMADYAVLARREGLLGLEEKIKEVKDPFLSKGIMLVVDGFAADSVRQILTIDIDAMKERHGIGKKMLDNMAGSAPAFGMVGTLIGLVAMLQNLSDPSSIGGSMAVALLATFYGAAVANCIFIPLATKLETRTKEEAQLRSLMVEGILSIQSGDKPQVLRERLKAYLAPGQRKLVTEGAGKTEGGE